MFFYSELKTVLRQEGQDYLDGNRKRDTSWSSLERFLTTVAETLQHVGAQSVSLWASLPGNLPIYSKGIFRVLEPWEGLFSTVKGFPYTEMWTL